MPVPNRNLQDLLGHVLWIGGPPDTGKTSIAALLAEKYGLQVYHFDRHEMEHFSRADPERHPALSAAHPDVMDAEERWLGSSPAAMASQTIASWTERFGMAVDDLLAMPSTPLIVAEGPGMFPECVAPLIADRRRAIWLVPSEAFKRASVARRQKLKGVPVSDHQRAVQNLIDRDLIMGDHVRERVAALNLPIHEIDGSKNLDEVTQLVEAHFSPWLSKVGRSTPR